MEFEVKVAVLRPRCFCLLPLIFIPITISEFHEVFIQKIVLGQKHKVTVNMSKDSVQPVAFEFTSPLSVLASSHNHIMQSFPLIPSGFKSQAGNTEMNNP